jgi:hypothetical protein
LLKQEGKKDNRDQSLERRTDASMKIVMCKGVEEKSESEQEKMHQPCWVEARCPFIVQPRGPVQGEKPSVNTS